MKKASVFVLAIIILGAPLLVFARLGVGIGLGKIQITEPIKPGGIYSFPSLPVFNTGDEPSDYVMGVEYQEGQWQIKPLLEWFSFNPNPPFYLEGGQSQLVEVKVTVPLKAKPGDYFAYLEARPVGKYQPGVTAIGIAAASRMHFTVIPANLWQAITWRVSTFWTMHAPWTWTGLGIVILAIIFVVIKRTFSFQIGVKKK